MSDVRIMRGARLEAAPATIPLSAIGCGTALSTVVSRAPMPSVAVPSIAASNRTASNEPGCALPSGGVELSVRGVRKTYRKGNVEIPVLRGVDLDVYDHEFVAVVGQSGSGKSTLLHVLGTLDAADEGEIYFQQQRIDNVPARQRDRLRNRAFGMVFQSYHLLPELTTLENVLMPLMIRSNGWSYWRARRQNRARAHDLLGLVGLGHRLRHRPRELSGGEMQRVAIARALISEPRVLLADEPTGNLDPETGSGIVELLRTLNRTRRLTIVMVTHDLANAERADRVVCLVDGRVRAA